MNEKIKKMAESDVLSPARTNEQNIKNITGTCPPTKTVEQIDKINSPCGRAKPPGSVRV